MANLNKAIKKLHQSVEKEGHKLDKDIESMQNDLSHYADPILQDNQSFFEALEKMQQDLQQFTQSMRKQQNDLDQQQAKQPALGNQENDMDSDKSHRSSNNLKPD